MEWIFVIFTTIALAIFLGIIDYRYQKASKILFSALVAISSVGLLLFGVFYSLAGLEDNNQTNNFSGQVLLFLNEYLIGILLVCGVSYFILGLYFSFKERKTKGWKYLLRGMTLLCITFACWALLNTIVWPERPLPVG